MKTVEIYAGGVTVKGKGVSTNTEQGIGAWAAILCFQGKEKEIYGGVAETTDNKLELKAIIEALSCLKEPCAVRITCSSEYIQRGVEEGLSTKLPVLNKEHWQVLELFKKKHTLSWCWLKEHADDPNIQRIAVLAKLGINDMTEDKG